MADSQEGTAVSAATESETPAAEPKDEAAGVTDPNTDSSTEDTNETADDFEAPAGLDEAVRNAATKAELDAVRRQTGHIPGLQSRLDKIEQGLKGGVTPDQFGEMNGRLDRLVAALEKGGLIDAADANGLQAPVADSSAAFEDRLAGIEDALRNPKAPANEDEAPEVSPETAALVAGWEASQDQVVTYAKEVLGMEDPLNEIPAPVWKAAFDASPNSPSDGALQVMREARNLKEAEDRRRSKAEAATGGDALDSRAPAKGGLTREMMKTMTPEQLMEYPRDERDRALAAG